ncbi:kinase-like domain-containing protein [Phaeosphaeria sp. MPI-PUGE-AT-0046c]|nr:kinase-like domain-containing protein [Phaeosphaeria sp. MPI-PUGE-AT-0046c]
MTLPATGARTLAMFQRTKWMGCNVQPLLQPITSILGSYRCPQCATIQKRAATQNCVNRNRELSEYTSGRWLFNESIRLLERRLAFNVDELKKAAARALGRPATEVKSLLKLLEGGFNRVFEITMEDGTSILARLPYPSTRPRRLAVASEVATMDFVRAHGIPTPQILGYAMHDNPVGSEYILMEKLPGKPIGDAWVDLSEQQRLQVLYDVVQLEAKLFDIKLPASGSIYYNKDLEPGSPMLDIEGFGSKFCVGRYTGLRWWFGTRQDLKTDRGPHSEPLRALQAPAEKELAWIHEYGRPRYPFRRQHREAFNYEKQDPSVHTKSLQDYLHISPHMLPKNPELLRPILRHPDVQPNNIFISEDFRISGLIDWQHSVALPTFLAAGIPNSFQNYNDAESRSFSPPQRPTGLDPMDDTERSRVLEEYRRRYIHFYYLGFTQRLNERHWLALEDEMDILRRRMFDHAGEPWEELDKLTSLNTGGNTKTCPVSFAQEEAERIDALDNLHREADGDVENINDLIGIGSDGWTTNELFEDAKIKAAEIREQALASANDDTWLRETSERHWPFDNFDEED